VNLARAANRKRAKVWPSEPTDLDFNYDDRFLPDGFLRSDLHVWSSRHTVFASNSMLDILSQAKTWYIDGTFKVVPAPFNQRLSVHAFVRSEDSMKPVTPYFTHVTLFCIY